MNPAPLVTVVMPARDVEGTIAGSIASVLRQTMPSLELLVVDDGMPGTVRSELVELSMSDRLPNGMSMRVLDSGGSRARPKGPGESRNVAIREAQGRYIAFLDADDIWHETKLSRQISFMEETSADLAFTAYLRVPRDWNGDGFGPGLPVDLIRARPSLQLADLLGRCPIGCLTVMYDTKRIGKQQMDSAYPSEDFALWLRLARDGARLRGLDKPLAVYRAPGQASVSSRARRQFKRNAQLFRYEVGLGRFRTALALARYVAGGINHRYGLPRLRGKRYFASNHSANPWLD